MKCSDIVSFSAFFKMPPKSKQKRTLEEAAKRAREGIKMQKLEESSATSQQASSDYAGPSTPSQSTTMPPPVPRERSIVTPTESEMSEDSTFDPEREMKENSQLKMDQFSEDWVASLDRDDRVSLGIFLTHHLEQPVGFSKLMAAEYTGMMVGKSEHTVRQWRTNFVENGFEVPDNKQGRYQRSGILWSSEELNEKATKYVRENANVKGQPNLTAGSFCQWINDHLLPNSNLEPGFPRKVSVETSRQWLHKLGFEQLSPSKGMYFDGHEREDVIVYRQKLVNMIEIGFLHPDQAPTPEAAQTFPAAIALASTETRNKTVVFFHDECTFQANDDQTRLWGKKGEFVIRPKSKGSGIMVSDFVDERNGYLRLTDEEYERVRAKDPTIKQEARAFLEYGESRDGYWNRDKFVTQLHEAIKIAEVKYPKSDGWKYVWIFDQSSCHTAMADDALDASKMNVNPGGKQPVMRDTMWAGKVQKMVFNLGIPKGMKAVLEERGINTQTLKGEQMRTILRNHDDFKNEQPKIIRFLEEKGHRALFLPKFHPELNPIERVWAQAKQYTKAYCKYNIISLRRNVNPGLDTVQLQNIKKFHRKARDYMFAYFEGHVAGRQLEDKVKLYKSHRRVRANV